VAAACQLESETESSVPEFPDSEAPALGFPVAWSVAAEVPFVVAEAPFAAARLEAVAAEHFAAAHNCAAVEKVADLEVAGNYAAVPGRCELVSESPAGVDVGWAHRNASEHPEALEFAWPPE
jgi:hypothetical protein